MSKLCSDGTGNQDIKNRGTNVFKLYEAVDIQGHKTDGNNKQQVAFYDDGVGTSRIPFVKFLGGACGWGFSRNVKKLYHELINVYEEEDSIYLFGFSRGAYTVRALAGFIQWCGIINKEEENIDKKIDKSWSEFKRETFSRNYFSTRRGFIPPEKDEKTIFRETVQRREQYNEINPNQKIIIKFIGVWDTVGAIGVPSDVLRAIINFFYPIWFSDNTLGRDIESACHALSIDDERRTFYPELWNEKDGKEERIKQVWFAGVHSNVGGGYPKQGMSLVTLDWMMNEATKAGLRFIDNDICFVKKHQDVHDKLYDSRSGAGLYYRWEPRDISKICEEHKIKTPKIHISVFERIACGTANYAPGNIPFDFEIDATSSLQYAWPTEPRRHAVQNEIENKTKAYLAHQTQTKTKTKTSTSLLDQMKGTIILGKFSYYTFLVLTVLFISSLINNPTFRKAVPGLIQKHGIGDLCSLLLKCSIWEILPIYVLCGGLIALLANLVDSCLEKKYRGFWHELRERLRILLS